MSTHYTPKDLLTLARQCTPAEGGMTMTVETLETIDRLLHPLRLTAGWRYLSYDARNGRGYASLTWDRESTPWYFSTENRHGLWSLSIHCPWAQLLIIGPFRRR